MEAAKLFGKKLVKKAKQHPVQTTLIVVLLVVSLVIRLNLSLTTPLYPGNTDPRHYHLDAMKPFEGGEITSVYWPPGYPFFIIPFYAIFGKTFITAKIVNTILSLLNAGLVFYVGRKLFNNTVGMISYAWMLFDPILTFYATNVYTETLFIALVIGSVALSLSQKEKPTWWKPTLIGALIGYSALIKPWVLVILGIFIVWWILNTKKTKQQYVNIAKWAGFMAIGVVIVLTPWTIHNYQAQQKFIPLPVHGPLNFYLGNHEHGTIAFVSTWPPESKAPFEGMTDMERAQKAKELAKEYVLEDPGRFISRIWTSFIKYWSHPNPHWFQRLVPNMNILLTYLWIKWGLVIIGLAYSLRQWKKHVTTYLWMGLMTGVFTMTLYLSRFKVPLIPFQILYAATAIVLIYDVVKQLIPKPAKT